MDWSKNNDSLARTLSRRDFDPIKCKFKLTSFSRKFYHDLFYLQHQTFEKKKNFIARKQKQKYFTNCFRLKFNNSVRNTCLIIAKKFLKILSTYLEKLKS